MMYYKTEKVAEEEIHMAEKAQQMGLDVAVLNKAEAQQMEPDIALDVLGAVHYRCDAHLYPNKLNQQLIQAGGGSPPKHYQALLKVAVENGISTFIKLITIHQLDYAPKSK